MDAVGCGGKNVNSRTLPNVDGNELSVGRTLSKSITYYQKRIKMVNRW